jgi:predicted nucleotidyltransferase/HEPN domain-containing protein
MKTSLDHLPKSKQSELEKIASVICEFCDEVQKIILFGSYARGDYKEAKDLDKFRKSGHVSDYDILVVTSTKEEALNHSLFNKIKDELKKLKLSADPRILTHDINALNIKLAEGQYFFSDIIKEGILLFDTNEFKLSEKRQLTDAEWKRIAQDNFDEWFKSATRFYRHFVIDLEEDDYKRGAFHLHQAAESALKTILLVFNNYLPNEHYLKFLQNDVEEFYPQINKFFKQDTKENEERVKLFEYAYIGGRYDIEYYISKEDLEIIEKDVKKLLEVTEQICLEKIKNF